MSKDANFVEVVPSAPESSSLPRFQARETDTPVPALWDEVTCELDVANPSPAPNPADESAARPSTVIGQMLGKCLLIERLGRGGSCSVYRALHQTLNIPVAVKVLQLESGEPRCRDQEQLQTEARLLARLNHPNIVRILDYQDDAASPYLVLECVEGPSLVELIQQSGRLGCDRAREIIAQVASGLAAIWDLGAVHRDVKPGNILLARNGTAKIADLGQAVLLADEAALITRGTALLPEQVAGTAAYMAPEQFLAPASVDHRSDMYALGATFYQAVTGRMPFEGRSRMEVLLKHAQEAPVPPNQLVAGVEPALSEIILTMLAKDPDNRFQDSDELLAALSDCSSKSAAVAAQAPTPPPVEPLPSAQAKEKSPTKKTTAAQTLRRQRMIDPRSGATSKTKIEPRTAHSQWLSFLRGTLTAPSDAQTTNG